MEFGSSAVASPFDDSLVAPEAHGALEAEAVVAVGVPVGVGRFPGSLGFLHVEPCAGGDDTGKNNILLERLGCRCGFLVVAAAAYIVRRGIPVGPDFGLGVVAPYAVPLPVHRDVDDGREFLGERGGEVLDGLLGLPRARSSPVRSRTR